MKKIFAILAALAICTPLLSLSTAPKAYALQMPTTGNDLVGMFDINATAYVVTNAKTGQVLMSKNADMQWTPASLTKLVTALVVLDTKPNIYKSVAMTDADQQMGSCYDGGACIKATNGVKFTVDGLFHALLLPSANNAAAALARSTGMNTEQFAAKMNAKVKALGATNSYFNEPTGMDPNNKITAADYAKVLNAAFANSYLRKVAQLRTYTLRSTNNWRYTQRIKNTDGLLTNADIKIVGAKTGYLDESKYNFASVLQYKGGNNYNIVVLGENHLYSAFADTQTLASLAKDAEVISLLKNPWISTNS